MLDSLRKPRQLLALMCECTIYNRIFVLYDQRFSRISIEINITRAEYDALIIETLIHIG